MRLTQIDDFVAVVECGSIRRAARERGVAQPTISKNLKSLEVELHTQLLNRSARGVFPTRAGRLFFTRARAAQCELRKAEEEVTQSASGEGGMVAFGAGPMVIPWIVPAAVARYRMQYPAVRTRIVAGVATALLTLVRDETLDFVIGLRPPSGVDASFKFRPLYRSHFAVVARKGHKLCNARSLAHLTDSDWVSTTTIGMPGGPLERIFANVGLTKARQVIQCDSYYTLVSLVAKTDVLAIMPRQLLEHPFIRDLVQEVRLVEPMPAATGGVFMRADSPLTRDATGMVKTLAAVARALTRSGNY